MIKVLFFGQIADIVASNSIELNESVNLSDLKKSLTEKYPKLEKLKFQIAVNKQIAKNDVALNPGDEVAFLPPFTGG